MRFAIVDDNPEVFGEIKEIISNTLSEYKTETDCFVNVSEFMDKYNHSPLQYDALFLDIDLPETSGFDIAEKLRNAKDDIPVVFITAFEDLVIKAFRYKVLGFVRKHNIQKELPYALETVMSELKNFRFHEITETRSHGNSQHRMPIRQITHIESHDHYVSIYLANGNVIEERKSLSFYLGNEKFNNFVLVSKGILVNMETSELSDNHVILMTGQKISVSRKYLANARKAFLECMRKVLI